MSEECETKAEVVETVIKKTGVDVIGIYKQAFLSDPKALIPVALAVLLWLVTLWVPFINIGTTIALFTWPVWMAAGRKLSAIDIFSGVHRERLFGLLRLHGIVAASSFVLLLVMGLALGRMYMMNLLAGLPEGTVVVGAGFWAWIRVLLIFAGAAVPFFMLTTAWSMAPFLMIDRDLEPSEALRVSYTVTEGRRIGIFAVYAPPVVAGLFLAWLLGQIPYVGGLFVAGVTLVVVTAVIALTARLYPVCASVDA